MSGSQVLLLLLRLREGQRRAVELRPPFGQISGLRLLDNLDEAIAQLSAGAEGKAEPVQAILSVGRP
jgi:hypothetical protein